MGRHERQETSIQREGRRAGHRVWHQIHGDLGQSLDKRRRGLHHVSQGYQGQNGKETGSSKSSSTRARSSVGQRRRQSREERHAVAVSMFHSVIPHSQLLHTVYLTHTHHTARTQDRNKQKVWIV